VTSDQGAPLELANVYIQEMNISVVSDSSGRYSINIPAERVRGQAATLRVRRIGFVAVSMPITISAGTQTHDFALKMDVNRLSDVIITGVSAGTEQKKVPFAVTQLNTADMPVPSSNALAQLQGKVPGAQIVMPSGQPGQAPAIVLRGPKSLNADGRSQGPLIIVDGIIMSGGTQDLNPLDIESIEVVKGAAGSSLYGSRAGAGVIQITTKSGRNAAAGLRFNVRNESGFSDNQGAYPYATRHFLMMDERNQRFCVVVTNQPACSRTIDFEEEALRINENGGDFALTPATLERDYGIGKAPGSRQELKGLFMVNQWPRRYDPIEQVATAGMYNQVNADMQGRFGNTGFYVSGSYQLDEGSIKLLEGDRRASARMNLDQRIGEQWNVQLATTYSRRSSYPSLSFFQVTRVPAGVDLMRRDRFGRLFIRSNPLNQGEQNANPLYAANASYGLSEFDRFLGSVITRYTPFEWLDFEMLAAMDRDRSNGLSMNDRGFRATGESRATAAEGAIAGSSNAGLSYNLGLTGTARHTFGSDLVASMIGRWTYEQEDNEGLSASGDALAVPGLRDLDIATGNFNIGSSESSVRSMGISGGLHLEFRDRYIFDGSYRVDGSSLFGEDQRWHPYPRGSFAWRVSDEPFWPFVESVNDLKLRASVGQAGGHPNFSAQYETFSIGAGGLVSAANLGNRDLKPQLTTETEYGVDVELFSRVGLNVTYARDITQDQIMEVPPSVASGYSNQWKNAGTVENRTWEFSANIPIITSRDLNWSSRVSWDQTRSWITELGVPEFNQTTSSSTFKYRVGEQIGTIYGKMFITNCSQLPAPFDGMCGPGQEWQRNDEGYVVWVGAGNTPGEGITKNLWQAERPGCLVGGVPVNVTGANVCQSVGGVVNSPWGLPTTHWGMLTVIRDSTATPVLQALGNTLPDYRITLSQTFEWKRLSAYGLVDRSHGNKLMNEELHWSLGDFNVRDEDQTGKSVEAAKPIGYYWRAPAPDGAGVGGFYDVLGANNFTVEDGSYTKIRELSVSYEIGELPGISGIGDWSITLTGKNLYTWTKFKGWDPEVGTGGGNLGTAAVNAVATYQYPQRRTFSFTLNSRF
jgi:TonB-linked SusC/RagA family outer membrane protein